MTDPLEKGLKYAGQKPIYIGIYYPDTIPDGRIVDHEITELFSAEEAFFFLQKYRNHRPKIYKEVTLTIQETS